MVAGASSRSEQHPLLRSIAALEVGDWATASWLGSQDLVNDDSPTVPLLAVVLRSTAGGMRDQAVGDLAAARSQYSDAAAMLPEVLHRMVAAGEWEAVLAPEPASHRTGSAQRCTWRAARIIWREQTLITDLVQRLTAEDKSRDHLIEAYIQFQFEIEFSPYSWSRPPDGTLSYPSVTPTRDNMCRRATSLRRLVLPRAKDISQSVWQDLGGHCGLRAAAQTRLAGRPLAPWTDGTGARALPPLRRGRQRAWEHARQWTGDLAYEDIA